MKQQIFAVYDLKAETFLPFFAETNRDTAIRVFQDACLGDDGIIGKHPEDFVLFEIGTYSRSLEMKQFENELPIVGCTPYMIATGASAIKQEEAQ